MPQNHPFYDEVSKYSYEGVLGVLKSQKEDPDPFLFKIVATMTSVLAVTAEFIRTLEEGMPISLGSVHKDISSIDSLSYVTASIQEAV